MKLPRLGYISWSSPSNKARQIFVRENSKPVIHSCIYYCCNRGRFLLRRPVRCRPDAARQFTYRQSHNSSWRPFKTTILSGGSRCGSNPRARWRCDHKHRNCITICRPVALGRGRIQGDKCAPVSAVVVGSPTKAALGTIVSEYSAASRQLRTPPNSVQQHSVTRSVMFRHPHISLAGYILILCVLSICAFMDLLSWLRRELCLCLLETTRLQQLQ